MEGNYNPTCAVTGRKDNLKMHAFRNSNNDMIGWIFLHEEIDPKCININIESLQEVIQKYNETVTNITCNMLDI